MFPKLHMAHWLNKLNCVWAVWIKRFIAWIMTWEDRKFGKFQSFTHISYEQNAVQLEKSRVTNGQGISYYKLFLNIYSIWFSRFYCLPPSAWCWNNIRFSFCLISWSENDYNLKNSSRKINLCCQLNNKMNLFYM